MLANSNADEPARKRNPQGGKISRGRSMFNRATAGKLLLTGVCAGLAISSLSCNGGIQGKEAGTEAQKPADTGKNDSKPAMAAMEIGKAYDGVVSYRRIGGHKNYSRNISYRLNEKGGIEYRDTFFDGRLGTAWMSAGEWKRRAFGEVGKKQFIVLFSTDSGMAKENTERLNAYGKMVSAISGNAGQTCSGAESKTQAAQKPENGQEGTAAAADKKSLGAPEAGFLGLITNSDMPSRILSTINEQEAHSVKKYEFFPYTSDAHLSRLLNSKYRIKVDSLTAANVKNGYLWITEPGKKLKAYFTIKKSGEYVFYKARMFRETGFTGIFERLKENIELDGGGSAQLISIIIGNAGARSLGTCDACALFATENFVTKEAVSGTKCVGLGQLTLNTAYSVKDTSGNAIFEKGDDLYDPEKNAAASVSYFSQQVAMFGSIPIAFAAYNTGPGSMKSYLAGNGFAAQKLNNPQEYAAIGAFFAKFFAEIGIEELEGVPVAEFMSTQKYRAAYEKLKQGITGHYLSGN